MTGIAEGMVTETVVSTVIAAPEVLAPEVLAPEVLAPEVPAPEVPAPEVPEGTMTGIAEGTVTETVVSTKRGVKVIYIRCSGDVL